MKYWKHKTLLHNSHVKQFSWLHTTISPKCKNEEQYLLNFFFFFFSTLDQQHVKPHPQISKKITRLLLMGTWEKLRLFSPATVPHRIFLAKAMTETHSPGKHTVASATRSSFLFLTSQLIQNTYSNFLNNWDESCKQQTLSLCCADSFQALFILQSEWGRVLWENKEWDHVIKDYLIMYTGIEL